MAESIRDKISSELKSPKRSEKVYGLHIPLALRQNSPGASSMWFDEQMMGHSGIILVIMSIILIMVIM